MTLYGIGESKRKRRERRIDAGSVFLLILLTLIIIFIIISGHFFLIRRQRYTFHWFYSLRVVIAARAAPPGGWMGTEEKEEELHAGAHPTLYILHSSHSTHYILMYSLYLYRSWCVVIAGAVSPLFRLLISCPSSLALALFFGMGRPTLPG